MIITYDRQNIFIVQATEHRYLSKVDCSTHVNPFQENKGASSRHQTKQAGLKQFK
jgi:hypothetical protein